MISAVSFVDFKIWRELHLSFGRLTVVVGPNASGKTSVLEGIHYLTQLGYKSTDALLYGPRSPGHLIRRGADRGTLQLKGAWAGLPGELSLTMIRQQRAVAPPEDVRESFVFEVKASHGEQEYAESDPEKVLWSGLPSLSREVSRAVFLHLEPRRLAMPSYSEREVPRVEWDGEGLASVVGFLALNQPDRFCELQEKLRSIVPTVERLRVRRARIQRRQHEVIRVGEEKVPRSYTDEVIGEELLFDMQGAEGIPAQAASEGTLLVVGLLAVLSGPTQPEVVLLDDLDRGLHPSAQRSLVTALRNLLAATPDLQVIATSHSPYLLDHLQHDEVRLTSIGSDGTAIAGSLLDHPDFERWKDVMSPGELWSSLGEQWLQQRPDSTGT